MEPSLERWNRIEKRLRSACLAAAALALLPFVIYWKYLALLLLPVQPYIVYCYQKIEDERIEEFSEIGAESDFNISWTTPAFIAFCLYAFLTVDQLYAAIGVSAVNIGNAFDAAVLLVVGGVILPIVVYFIVFYNMKAVYGFCAIQSGTKRRPAWLLSLPILALAFCYGAAFMMMVLSLATPSVFLTAAVVLSVSILFGALTPLQLLFKLKSEGADAANKTH